jgi:hypothetical protein
MIISISTFSHPLICVKRHDTQRYMFNLTRHGCDFCMLPMPFLFRSYRVHLANNGPPDIKQGRASILRLITVKTICAHEAKNGSSDRVISHKVVATLSLLVALVK